MQFQEKMDGTAQQPASLNSTHWHQTRMHLQRHQEIEQNNGMQWQETFYHVQISLQHLHQQHS
jgi:hypothetical protein